MLDKINAFMNDPDRGAGHGISHGLFYGVVLISLTPLGPQVVALGVLANYLRVFLQELIIEGWIRKPKEGDFYFDTFCRPTQSALVALVPWCGVVFLPLLVICILAVGYKKKNGFPFLMVWK